MPADLGDVENRSDPDRRNWPALVTILITVAITVIDAGSVNVILPHVAQDFGIPPAEVILVVSAHQITLVAMLLPCASLAEKYGYRRMLRIGLSLFVISSAVCFLAGSMPELVAARVAVGIAGACTLSATTAMVRLSQPIRLIGRTIGMVATVVAVSTGLGPAIATAIVVHADWRWIFVPSIACGAVALVLSSSLPVVRDPARQVDLVSATLTAGAFSLLIGGVGNALEKPASAAFCIALGLSFVLVLLRRERMARFPILPVDLFRLRQFSIAVAGSACLFLAQMSAFVALPFHFLAYFDETKVGMLLMVWPVAVALTAPCAGRVSDRMPANLLCAIGSALLGTGLAALVFFPGSSLASIIPALVLCGVGFGMFQTPNNRQMQLSVPISRVGAAGGMQGTTRQFGQAMGASIATLAFTLSATAGARLALGVGALAACAAFAISIFPRRAA